MLHRFQCYPYTHTYRQPTFIYIDVTFSYKQFFIRFFFSCNGIFLFETRSLCFFFLAEIFHLSLVLWCVTNLFFVMFFPIICIYFFIGVYFSFYTPIVAMFGVFHLLFFLKDFKKFYSFPFICWKNPRFLTKSILLWYENLFKVSNFYCDRWKREGERDLRMTESRIFLSMNNNNWKWKREFSRIYIPVHMTQFAV